jgi:hypothetical protein
MHFNVYTEAPKLNSAVISTKSAQQIEKEKEEALMNKSSSASSHSREASYSANTSTGSTIKLKSPSSKNPRKKAPKGKTSFAYL